MATGPSENLSKIDKMAESRSKIIKDSIHGCIEMHPLCVAIIDTPQFQRLRSIKQMGGCYFVYPGASHNRFEHSIGTSYLAGCLVQSLKTKLESDDKSEFEIDEKDELCVKIAGLCHDLGHGPFSHMFDNDFIPKVRELERDVNDVEDGNAGKKKWTHEEASKEMFDHLIRSNKRVQELLAEFKLDKQDDIEFIKRLMTGETPTSKEEWKKCFLFEIVANKRNGIDVDKWDYFARDCSHLGIKSSFDYKRCIETARVIKAGPKSEPQICFRDNVVGDIYDMFYTRLNIHKKACQHKTANAIEMMITDALLKANDHLKFKGKDQEGNEVIIRMSEAIRNMDAYTNLTDHVYYQILYSSNDELQEARKILQDIEERKVYKFIGFTIPKDQPAQSGVPAMQNEIFDILKKRVKGLEEKDKDIVIVQLAPFSYGGMEDGKNPVDKVRFYTKDDQSKAAMILKDQVSRILPDIFAEKEIRVYCRKRDDKLVKEMKEAFKKWCFDRGYQYKFTLEEHTLDHEDAPDENSGDDEQDSTNGEPSPKKPTLEDEGNSA